jgi:hypothetical protein
VSSRHLLGSDTRLADAPFVALMLSAVYPAVFLLSLNWYALTTEKIVFVLLAPAGTAVAMYLFIRFAAWALFACLHASRVERQSRYVGWKPAVTLLLTALACSVTLFFFMYGTLQTLLRNDIFLLLCFLALTALISWLALNRRLRYWTAPLGVMTLISLVTWAHSIVAARVDAATEERHLIRSPLNSVTFKSRPNIYLIVYDAYGNRRLHREVFGVDNGAIYQGLAARNFKVIDTYSNYWGTWESMLSVFLGSHHYYDLMTGVFDSRIGRWIMNGKTFNPVLSVLRNNGYKVQYIEATDYLVKDQGNLDYVYPDVSEPLYTGLRVFNNPLFDLLPSVKVAGAKPNTVVGYVNTMTEILFGRLQQTIKNGTPWFTYIHFPLPAHAGGPFRSLRSWEDVYRENTRRANAHMLLTIDRILAMDPSALIVIMGDHGSYRYSEAWEGADNPNDAFKVNGIESDVATVDYFGILMAIRSRGQCDDFVYENMTPVNLMRVIFSCLSDDRKLLESRTADISIFPYGFSRITEVPSALYMTVKDGKILKPWIKIDGRHPG